MAFFAAVAVAVAAVGPRAATASSSLPSASATNAPASGGTADSAGAASPGGPGMTRLRDAGVLRWGADTQGGEPFVYPAPEDPSRVIGFEVDLARALARELGLKDEFVQNDWSRLVPSLERGTFDIALNGLEVTPAWSARVRFTEPYYAFSERLMARKGDVRITPDLNSLRGLRVGTLASSLAFDVARRVAEPVVYEGVEEPYFDLVHGRTDAVLMDDIIAARYGETKPELRVVGDVADGHYAIAVRPDDIDVKEALNRALAELRRTGELKAILVKARLWNERQDRLAGERASVRAGVESAPTPPPPEVSNPPHLSWAYVRLFVKGALVTLLLSGAAMALAMPLGLLLALGRVYGPKSVRLAVSGYVEVYRGTPVLLQLYVLYYGLAPIVRMDAFTAAVVGLGMNYAAYEAEVYRAGIQAVPRGQLDAAYALGMPTSLALRRVVLPQALRFSLPNVTNDFIALLKDSSLVSVITVVELTKQMTITAVDVRSWLAPGALCAFLYFAMSYPLARLSRRLETRLARS